MPSIQANSVAVRGLLGLRRDPSPKPRGPSSDPSSDQAMMYAWSIGTTPRAAEYPAPADKKDAPAQEEHHAQECPPEVYLG